MSNDRVYTGNNGSKNRRREKRTQAVKCEFKELCGSGNRNFVQCDVRNCPLKRVNK